MKTTFQRDGQTFRLCNKIDGVYKNIRSCHISNVSIRNLFGKIQIILAGVSYVFETFVDIDWDDIGNTPLSTDEGVLTIINYFLQAN